MSDHQGEKKASASDFIFYDDVNSLYPIGHTPPAQHLPPLTAQDVVHPRLALLCGGTVESVGPPSKKAKGKLPTQKTKIPVIVVDNEDGSSGNDNGKLIPTDVDGADDEVEGAVVHMVALDKLAVQDTGSKRAKSHQVRSGEDKRTLNVNLMFTSTYAMDRTTLVSRRCNVCRNANKRTGIYQSSTGISTLRDHIRRAGRDHYPTYRTLCKANSVAEHARCIPVQTESIDTESLQSSLDPFVAAVPTFSREGVLSHIIELVVKDDQAFLLVEREEF
ncbi:hypothetical protein DFH11DRAFT_1728730 [Phellopilus nigrolimitatus]|nr:hypothetical protein DFH11DRAFT_1728730 [Phellopilus nigrolimitatus]